MIRIVDKRAVERKTVNAFDIPMGTAFKGKIGSVRGVFIRTYDGVVLLCEPECTWDGGCSVVDYEPVDLIVEVVPINLPTSSSTGK